jgi:hypothetical protein
VVFLKLFERIYAPLTAGLLNPFRADTRLQHEAHPTRSPLPTCRRRPGRFRSRRRTQPQSGMKPCYRETRTKFSLPPQ